LKVFSDLSRCFSVKRGKYKKVPFLFEIFYPDPSSTNPIPNPDVMGSGIHSPIHSSSFKPWCFISAGVMFSPNVEKGLACSKNNTWYQFVTQFPFQVSKSHAVPAKMAWKP